jgi:hypothetical protein
LADRDRRKDECRRPLPDKIIKKVWKAVFLLEMLITAFPNKHYVMIDHDAAFLYLFEIKQLERLVKTTRLPFLHHKDSKPGIITFNELWTRNNAGIVIFPCENPKRGTSDITSGLLVQKVKAERKRFLNGPKHPFPQQLERDPHTMELRVKDYQQVQHECDFADLIPDHDPSRAWHQTEHHLEYLISRLKGTELYRAQAHSPADFLHAWALLGTVANRVGFNRTNESAKVAHNTYVTAN